MKVVFATPTWERPTSAYLTSLEACLPAVEAAGFEHQAVNEIGCQYISAARARMLGKALAAKADIIVFIDDDMEWGPEDMVKLLRAPGDVVGGTYRFKQDEERYMGVFMARKDGKPYVRQDGLIRADRLPAGFLKVTRDAVEIFSRKYPQLVLHAESPPSVDLFNHGAHKGMWWGEDYSFTRRYREKCGDVWCLPDLNLTHHDRKGKAYPGNFHLFMLKK